MRQLSRTLLLWCWAVELFAIIPEWPTQTYTNKPWTRWWWHGNAVDSINIVHELKQFKDAGFGGVEITSIYSVKNNAENNITYLSPKFAEILTFTLETAHETGLQVDLPMGTGWRNGGSWIDSTHADSRLVVDSVRVSANELYQKKFSSAPSAVLVVQSKYKRKVLKSAITNFEYHNKSAQDHILYFAFQKPSGAKVKRPSPGGEGFAFNPFSRKSTALSLHPFKSFFEKIPTQFIRCQFHDSYEYTGNWSDDIFPYFQKYYHYNLAEYLPELNGIGDMESIKRVKCDYRECLSKMLQEHFLKMWKAEANNYQHKIRNQGHGSPANLLDIYAMADIPETEIFSRDQHRDVLKFASSAAHIMGRRLVSAESFTWQDEHFNVTLDTMKSSADLLFLSGVNHIFYHGTAYSPLNAAWPGWVFYASTQVNSQNPMWMHLPKLNNYITRCQSILQQSLSDNDVLVYWPVYDEWMKPDGTMQKLTVHNNEWITQNPAGKVAKALYDRGFLYDFISDKQIENLEIHDTRMVSHGSDYQSIIIPACQYIPLTTLKALISLAKKGEHIYFQKPVPVTVPGFYRNNARQKRLESLQQKWFVENHPNAKNFHLFSDWQEYVRTTASISEINCKTKGLDVLRQKTESGHYIYFIVNKSHKRIDEFIQLGQKFKIATLYNAMTGDIGQAHLQPENNSIRLQLEKNESIIVHTGESAENRYPYVELQDKSYEIAGEWNVHFEDGGPTYPPNQKVDSLRSWTELHLAAETFCGKAVYSVCCDAPKKQAGSYMLDLGQVAESATVFLNGKKIDTLIAAPFRVRLDHVQATQNVLEIEVVNLAANRIRDLDRRGVEWRIFDDINFVNIDYKPFDASGWPIRDSGLLGPVSWQRIEYGPSY